LNTSTNSSFTDGAGGEGGMPGAPGGGAAPGGFPQSHDDGPTVEEVD